MQLQEKGRRELQGYHPGCTCAGPWLALVMEFDSLRMPVSGCLFRACWFIGMWESSCAKHGGGGSGGCS